MTKKIEYFVQKNSKNLSLTNVRTKVKKEAFESYRKFCEDYPKDSFSIVKRTVCEEVIAESDDHRQAKFDFAV